MKDPYEYNVGDDTPNGKISRIFYKGTGYLIFETNNADSYITYITQGNYPSDWKSPINTHLMEIHSLIQNKKEGKRYKSRIASAYYEALHGNIEGAQQLLIKLKELIQHSHRLKSRLIYLLGSLSLVILNILIALFANIWKEEIVSNFLTIINIATFGSLGGFLSISFNFRRIDIVFEESKSIAILSGISRIFIAMISSVIVYAIIKSNLALGIFNDSNNEFVFLAIGALSGFSERFVPNILKTLEKDSSEKK